MPAKPPPPSPFLDEAFPVSGIDVSVALEQQRPQTTPLGVNVRAFEPETLRARGGSRPGLVKFIPVQVDGFSHVIQHLAIVVDPQAEALLTTFPVPTEDNPSSGGRGDFWDGTPIQVPIGGTGYTVQADSRPILLTITADDQDKKQGDEFTWTGHEFTAAGLIAGDIINSVQFSSRGSPASAPSGRYPILCAAADISYFSIETIGRHYKVSYVPGTMTVEVELDITANNQTKAQGVAFSFTGNEFSQVGLLAGDTIDSAAFDCEGASSSAPAGVYPIDVSNAQITLAPGHLPYSITYHVGVMIVTGTQPDLTITANDIVKPQGDTFVWDGTEYGQVGLLSGDSITSVQFASAGAASSAANGTYAIVPSNAVVVLDAGHVEYNITYVNGEMVVRQLDSLIFLRQGAGLFTHNCPLSVDVLEGSLLLVFTDTRPSTIPIDTLGTGYTLGSSATVVVDSGSGPFNMYANLWYGFAGSSGPLTVSVNDSPFGFGQLGVIEFVNVDPILPVDSINSSSGSGANWTTGVVNMSTTTRRLSALIGFVVAQGAVTAELPNNFFNFYLGTFEGLQLAFPNSSAAVSGSFSDGSGWAAAGMSLRSKP